jgi:hypothetical protein
MSRAYGMCVTHKKYKQDLMRNLKARDHFEHTASDRKTILKEVLKKHDQMVWF